MKIGIGGLMDSFSFPLHSSLIIYYLIDGGESCEEEKEPLVGLFICAPFQRK